VRLVEARTGDGDDPARVRPGHDAAAARRARSRCRAGRRAKQFVAGAQPALRKLIVDASVAQWANETDLTPEHEAATAKAARSRASRSPSW